MMRAIALFCVAACCVLATPPALAAGADDTDVSSTLERMAERIEALERDNANLRSEVGALRDQADQPWLDEQRAKQIRAVVEDVLADADSRASLQGSGLTAGWDGGFFLSSPDGRFLLRIDGQMQFRFIWNYINPQTATSQEDKYLWGFENTRTHLTFRGHVFDRSINYLVRLAASRGGGGTVNDFDEANGGQVQLLDAWVRWRMNDQWSGRIGQFKLPFSREELVSSAYQLTIERSTINESMGIGRSQGMELEYQGDFIDWRFAYSDGGTDTLLGVGVLAGTSPPNTPWNQTDTEYAFTSRLEWLVAGGWDQFEQMTSPPGTPFGLLLGVAGHYQQGEFGPAANESRWFNSTADVSVGFGGASLYGAVYYSYLDTATFGVFEIFGAVAQGSIYIAPKWELFLQYQYGYVDSKRNVVNLPDLSILTGGVNWYIDGQDLKLSFDVGVALEDVSNFWAFNITGYRQSGSGAGGQVVIRTQFQLLF